MFNPHMVYINVTNHRPPLQQVLDSEERMLSSAQAFLYAPAAHEGASWS
ncbi:hypothetical protein [Enterobacter roggenkampii]|nr:hypothetical protein [Enterobacter roggenkampii]